MNYTKILIINWRVNMKNVILYFLTLLVFGSNSFAQITISSLTFKVGAVRNFQNVLWNNYNIYAFNPELEIGGKFISSYIQWGVNFSYWDDGIDEPLPIPHNETISYSNYSFGLRLITTPNIFKYSSNPINLSLVTGLDYNIRNGTIISYINEPIPAEGFFQPYLGLQLSYKILNEFSIMGEALGYINVDAAKERVGFWLGGKYNFN